MKTLKKFLATTCLVATIINSNAQTASWSYGTNVATLNPATANLGIGTTNPAYKLDVVGTTKTDRLLINKPNTVTNWNNLWQSGFFEAEKTAANAPESSDWFWGINMGHSSNASNYRYGGQIAIRNSNTTPTMYFRSTNVNGIGTWAKVLHNIGTQNIKGRMSISPEGCAPDEAYSGNVVITKPTNSGQYINLIREGSFVWSIGTIYNKNTFAIGQGKTTDSQFTNPFFTIGTSGYVGIGTATPGAKLRIFAEGNPSNTEGNVNNGLEIYGNDQGLYMGVNSTSHVSYIQSVDYGTDVAPLIINARGGNVGIGTTSPFYKLDVEGTIRAHEIVVNLELGADFVFEENYTLRSLDEVSDFIQANKHLPEIPSAANMVENGVDMGEFQIKLLQKIEELTLYIIEQDKRIKELENTAK